MTVNFIMGAFRSSITTSRPEAEHYILGSAATVVTGGSFDQLRRVRHGGPPVFWLPSNWTKRSGICGYVGHVSRPQQMVKNFRVHGFGHKRALRKPGDVENGSRRIAFAQFERELVGERTRDKTAAARRKGKWTGGYPVLGYDLDPGRSRLVINEQEAVQVRGIFELFLRHRSFVRTLEEIQRSAGD